MADHKKRIRRAKASLLSLFFLGLSADDLPANTPGFTAEDLKAQINGYEAMISTSCEPVKEPLVNLLNNLEPYNKASLNLRTAADKITQLINDELALFRKGGVDANGNKSLIDRYTELDTKSRELGLFTKVKLRNDISIVAAEREKWISRGGTSPDTVSDYFFWDLEDLSAKREELQEEQRNVHADWVKSVADLKAREPELRNKHKELEAEVQTAIIVLNNASNEISSSQTSLKKLTGDKTYNHCLGLPPFAEVDPLALPGMKAEVANIDEFSVQPFPDLSGIPGKLPVIRLKLDGIKAAQQTQEAYLQQIATESARAYDGLANMGDAVVKLGDIIADTAALFATAAETTFDAGVVALTAPITAVVDVDPFGAIEQTKNRIETFGKFNETLVKLCQKNCNVEGVKKLGNKLGEVGENFTAYFNGLNGWAPGSENNGQMTFEQLAQQRDFYEKAGKGADQLSSVMAELALEVSVMATVATIADVTKAAEKSAELTRYLDDAKQINDAIHRQQKIAAKEADIMQSVQNGVIDIEEGLNQLERLNNIKFANRAELDKIDNVPTEFHGPLNQFNDSVMQGLKARDEGDWVNPGLIEDMEILIQARANGKLDNFADLNLENMDEIARTFENVNSGSKGAGSSQQLAEGRRGSNNSGDLEAGESIETIDDGELGEGESIELIDEVAEARRGDLEDGEAIENVDEVELVDGESVSTVPDGRELLTKDREDPFENIVIDDIDNTSSGILTSNNKNLTFIDKDGNEIDIVIGDMLHDPGASGSKNVYGVAEGADGIVVAAMKKAGFDADEGVSPTTTISVEQYSQDVMEVLNLNVVKTLDVQLINTNEPRAFDLPFDDNNQPPKFQAIVVMEDMGALGVKGTDNVMLDRIFKEKGLNPADYKTDAAKRELMEQFGPSQLTDNELKNLLSFYMENARHGVGLFDFKPSNVGFGPDGEIFLVDKGGVQLMHDDYIDLSMENIYEDVAKGKTLSPENQILYDATDAERRTILALKDSHFFGTGDISAGGATGTVGDKGYLRSMFPQNILDAIGKKGNDLNADISDLGLSPEIQAIIDDALGAIPSTADNPVIAKVGTGPARNYMDNFDGKVNKGPISYDTPPDQDPFEEKPKLTWDVNEWDQAEEFMETSNNPESQGGPGRQVSDNAGDAAEPNSKAPEDPVSYDDNQACSLVTNKQLVNASLKEVESLKEMGFGCTKDGKTAAPANDNTPPLDDEGGDLDGDFFGDDANDGDVLVQ